MFHMKFAKYTFFYVEIYYQGRPFVRSYRLALKIKESIECELVCFVVYNIT